jgi:hypothetical protein
MATYLEADPLDLPDHEFSDRDLHNMGLFA